MEALGDLGHRVAVGHPHLLGGADLGQPLEQGMLGADVEIGAAELAHVVRGDLAAQLLDHGLLAVADAQDGDAQGPESLGGPRGARVENGGGAPGKDHALRRQRGERVAVELVEGVDLAVDPALPQAARDELRHLGAEVHDQDEVVPRRRHGARYARAGGLARAPEGAGGRRGRPVGGVRPAAPGRRGAPWAPFPGAGVGRDGRRRRGAWPACGRGAATAVAPAGGLGPAARGGRRAWRHRGRRRRAGRASGAGRSGAAGRRERARGGGGEGRMSQMRGRASHS